MMTSTSESTLRECPKEAFTKKRRQAGTSLVEILVVIVIFLIGILAVVQIFPGGFRLLLVSRSNSVATALGRDEIERLKDRPDLLPDEVLSVQYANGIPAEDPTRDPLSLAPIGSSGSTQIDSNGVLSDANGTLASHWLLGAGPNVARRIVGEGARVPAPRTIGTLYGGLMVLEHGPIDSRAPIVAYGNELSRTVGTLRESTPGATLGVASGANGFNATLVATPISTAPFEFFAEYASSPDASILLPTTTHDRTYRVRLSGLVGSGTQFQRVDYVSLPLSIPATTAAPLVRVRLVDLLHAANALPSGLVLGSAETDSIRVAPQYRAITSGGFSGDPFEMRVLDSTLGVLLFSPAARDGVVSRPGGVNEPLLAKVDYDVMDWRVLRSEFRVVSGNTTLRLPLASLKVGSQPGPDGLPNGGIPGLEAGTGPTDNVAVVDLTTGTLVGEGSGNVVVDKSRGVVTLVPDASDGMIPLTGAAGSFRVNPENRTFRVLYRARQEWSVQLVKSASQYSVLTNGDTPGTGQCSVGLSGGVPTRIYFPKSDVGRKVTIDTIVYELQDGTVKTLEGQDFVVAYPSTAGAINLPCVDIKSVINDEGRPPAQQLKSLSLAYGEPVRGVKGASVAVRVLWNPDQFRLAGNNADNLGRVEQWERSYRKSVTETYLRAEETR